MSPATDPPVIEAPPTATLLGRIFAHRRGKRTVVSVPLVRVDDPQVPANAPAEDPVENAGEDEAEPWVPAVEPDVVPPAPAPDPVRTVAVEAPAPPAPEEAAPEVPEPADVGGDGAVSVDAAGAAGAAATRYCGMCGERVPVEADGLHCYLGHRLSPAHAERQRGGWLRRLFRRG